MKKLLFAFIFLFTASIANAGVLQAVVGSGAVSCGIKYQVTDGAATQSFGRYSTDLYLAVSFVPDVTVTAYRISIPLLKYGSPTGNITMSICTMTGDGHPNVCTSADATLAESTETTSAAYYEFSFASGYAFTATTTYTVKLTVNRAVDAFNYSLIQIKANGSSTPYLHISADGTTWSAQSSHLANIKLSDCPL